jgi:hypothetical protein
VIELHIPFFPPSTNHAYYVRQGRLHLSEVGKAFKNNVTAHVARTYPGEMLFFKENVPYLLYLKLFSADGIENKGWPNSCKTRYKKFDASNRVKLVEDALRVAFGIDDSQFIAVCSHKCQGKAGAPCVIAKAWNLEEERSPLDGFNT